MHRMSMVVTWIPMDKRLPPTPHGCVHHGMVTTRTVVVHHRRYLRRCYRCHITDFFSLSFSSGSSLIIIVRTYMCPPIIHFIHIYLAYANDILF